MSTPARGSAAPAAATVPPARAPRWTVSRLRFVLTVAYGAGARGGPDTAAAAAALGVSRRQVQRWLHGKDRALARVPAARLKQIERAVRPDPETLRQEQLSDRYAHAAIQRIAEDSGVLPAWRDRHWLEPHLVVVLDLPALRLRQVATTRTSDRALHELRKRGKVIDSLTVPTRFHATALMNAVLVHLDAWRICAPPGAVAQGRTLTWAGNAPAVRLAKLAVTAERPPAPSGQ